ncbi:MAG: histidine phosphatase family protein [Bacteroidia bacterium]|nr:histidine phosphatase family protein [Bacteroidia bacterium]
MNKTVIFMRHGKTEDFSDSGEDFERILVQRGRIEVAEAAIALKSSALHPQIILASPAFRAAATARIVANILGIQIEYWASLYMGSIQTYIDTVNKHDMKSILVVGHNPSVGELAMQFSGYHFKNYPTSTLAGFEFQNQNISLDSKAKLVFEHIRK